MSTDRELLELAAKAAGHELVPWDNELGFVIRSGIGFPQYWNPITEDGDALRLAVKLEIDIAFFAGSVTAREHLASWSMTVQHDNQNVYIATRRAIVHVAAEIGRSMP